MGNKILGSSFAVRQISVLVFLSFIISNDSYSQIDFKNTVIKYKYRIQLKDKKNSPYSIDNPSQYLSSKSIQRRINHNIKVDYSDLPPNPRYIDSIKKTGIRILEMSKWLNYIVIDTNKTDSNTLRKINSFSFVDKIEPVALISLIKKPSPGKFLPEKSLDAGVVNLFSENYKFRTRQAETESNTLQPDDFYKYGYSYPQIDMIACNFLHEKGFRGKGMTIAVLDAGYRGADKLPVFDSLRHRNRIKGTKDFVIPGGNVYSSADHGTMVLSIMGGNIPQTFIGAAPEADYWLLKTEDVRSENIIEEDNWVAGIEFADSVGADLVNSSLGYTRFEIAEENHNYVDLNGKTARASIAATMAAKKGILVVNSAGNEGNDVSWIHISVPADADSIISVGAVDIRGQYVSFSSQGPSYDKRIKPDVSALGMGAAVSSSSGEIILGSGTSFSSPLIAGMTACLWQTKTEESNLKIIDVIIKSANHYKNPDNFTGYGIPNAAAGYRILHNVTQEQETVNSLIVSPNPFINKISIILVSTDTNNLNIELFDILGRKVYSVENIKKYSSYSYFSIDNLEKLNTGIYFIRIDSGAKLFLRKLIKVK